MSWLLGAEGSGRELPTKGQEKFVEMLKKRHSEWDRTCLIQNGILHEPNYSDDLSTVHLTFL